MSLACRKAPHRRATLGGSQDAVALSRRVRSSQRGIREVTSGKENLSGGFLQFKTSRGSLRRRFRECRRRDSSSGRRVLHRRAATLRSPPRGPNPAASPDPCPRKRPARCGCPRSVSGDRKSTRLNSSHQIISYAVFCLKKKNTTTADCAPTPV